MLPRSYGSQKALNPEKSHRREKTYPLSSISASSLKRQKYLDQKRKIDSHKEPQKRLYHSDDEDDDSCFSQPRRKVFVNEEKMTAKLRRLSLDPAMKNYNFTSQSPWFPNKNGFSSNPRKALEEIDKRLSDSDEEDFKEESSTSVIKVSEPLRAMLKQKNEVLPDSIAKIISNPCTDLVLWKPPSTPMEELCRNIRTKPSRTSQMVSDKSNLDLSVERPLNHVNGTLNHYEDEMDV